MHYRSFALLTLYLGAIVSANLLLTRFGPTFTIVNSLVLIGIDISVRDALHSGWEGKHLWARMAALIAAGSVLTWAMNHAAGRISLASLVAFSVSSAVDATVFQVLKQARLMYRVNVSNVVSAATDTVLFLVIAFGTLPTWVGLGQFLAKVLGGLVWGILLHKLSLYGHGSRLLHEDLTVREIGEIRL